MTPERWQRVSELYEAVLDRPAEERGAFLAELCAGDTALRGEVESLLAQDGRHTCASDHIALLDHLGIDSVTCTGNESVGPSS